MEVTSTQLGGGGTLMDAPSHRSGCRDPAVVGAEEGRMPSLVALGETPLSALVFHLQTEEDYRKVLKIYTL